MTERSLTSSALAALGRENPPPSRLFDQMKVSEASTGVGERLTLDRTLGEVEHTSPQDNDSKCTCLRSSCFFTTRWTLLPMWRANASVLRGSDITPSEDKVVLLGKAKVLWLHPIFSRTAMSSFGFCLSLSLPIYCISVYLSISLSIYI